MMDAIKRRTTRRKKAIEKIRVGEAKKEENAILDKIGAYSL